MANSDGDVATLTKDQAVELLSSNGYTAAYENGMPVVHMSCPEYDRTIFPQIESFLRDHGYDASFGVKFHLTHSEK